MKWLHNLLHNHAYNDTFTLLLYWAPMCFNAIAYAVRVYRRVQADKKAIRDMAKYHEWLKVGHLVGYVLATSIPLVNLVWFVFDAMGELWSMVYWQFRRLFNIRLVGGQRAERA